MRECVVLTRAPGASEDLIAKHYRRVYRLCWLLLGDRHEAEDVTQEVFLKAHEHATGTIENWGAWLTRVAVNAAHDRRRVGWWPRWRRATDDIDDMELPSQEPTPEQAFAGAEMTDRIWDAFWALSARQRQVFVLRHLEGWSTAAVATSLGMRPGTVKRHLFRAVHALGAAIHREG